MNSEHEDEYIVAIHKIMEHGKRVRNSDLARFLNITPPSVTSMTQKLAEKNLVEYEAYKSIILTAKGLEVANKIQQKHCLLECFFQYSLGLNHEKAHKEASQMKLNLSDEAAAALCRNLNRLMAFPTEMKSISRCHLDNDYCEKGECNRR